MKSDSSEIIIYQTEDGQTKIDVRMENETLWLSQAQIAELFGRDTSVISRHIKNIFNEDELNKKSNLQNLQIPNSDKPVAFYSLEVIIAVGYRVKSVRGTQFRQWATAILQEYLQKGFSMNDELLKAAGGGNYWHELLDRIRDIRSSEKALYRQVLDLYATSMDYNAKAEETLMFFKVVQNKLHFTVSGQTASEIIFNRANAELPFMGLTNFSGNSLRKSEIGVAKNYMTEDELFALNRLVSAFFDLAELKARNHEPMYMKDWLAELDKFTNMYGKGTLQGAGNVSHKDALEKAEAEYEKYRQRTVEELSPVERDFLENIKQTQKKLDGKVKRERTGVDGD
ncbi:MAG TPA: virulence RhuM family protein [Desulfitobacteriaceae bacterium]|nr:virulence RhuM family protein [Desulfitobacteriaceae bacterium]